MVTTWWFVIDDEESDLCGEEFFVEVEGTMDIAKQIAINKANELFPDIPYEKIKCYGRVSNTEAEMMGLDTY